MKPGPKKGFGKKAKYTIPELFEKWVDRDKCPRCGELVNVESFPLHLDFCKVKSAPNQHSYKQPGKP